MGESGRPYPRAVNHVGLAVPDLRAAIDWYGKVLGFELFAGPFDLAAGDDEAGRLVRDVVPGVNRLRLAHLATGGGAGLELFEFVDPAADLAASNALPPRTGWFHICVTDPDPAGLASRIAGHGGRQRSQVWPAMGGGPCCFVYAEDPWGNLIEIYSHDYQRMNAAKG